MPNKRVFWAVEGVGFAPDGSQTYTTAHGVQSVGITTTFNLEPIFELGQIRIYENLENIPDIEVTMEKVMDGYPLLYHLSTRGATGDDLAARSNQKTAVALSIFPDTNSSASGVPVAQVVMSGLFCSSLNYSFPVDGPFKEAITLVGNEKRWRSSAFSFSGNLDNTDQPLAKTYDSGGIQRRQHLLYTYTTNTQDVNGQTNTSTVNPGTILPPDVAGITSSGTNNQSADGLNYGAAVQNITVSTNLGRESIFELGRRIPYCRYVTFPVEVTTEIEVISKSGDWVSATEAGVYSNGYNTREATIKIATRDGLFLDMGTKNRLSNVSVGGGDTGGGNQTITYSFSTYNDLTCSHYSDPG